MVDFGTLRSGDVGRSERRPDGLALAGQLRNVGQRQRARRIVAEEKPVAAPGDVAGYAPQAFHLDRHIAQVAIARDIFDRHLVSAAQLGGDGTDRRFEPVATRRDAAHVRKRDGDADGGVAAHAEEADIVEEDEPRSAIFVRRPAEQGAHQPLMAPGFVHDEAAQVIEIACQAGPQFGHRARSQIGPALDDESRGLALGMGIDDPHRDVHAASLQPEYQALNRRSWLSA